MAIDSISWTTRNFIDVLNVGKSLATTNAELPNSIRHAVYYQGYDIHMLRNNIPNEDLRKYLIVKDSLNRKEYRLIDALAIASLNIKKAEFLPLLINGENFNDADVSGPFPAPGFRPPSKALYKLQEAEITVDTYSGQVRAQNFVSPDPPSYMKNINFVLLIRITVDQGGVLEIFETAVRFHIHEGIDAAWITPTTLTMRENDIQRLSIYAQFSEGLVGDVSVHPHTIWTTTGGGVRILHDDATPSNINGLFRVVPVAPNTVAGGAVRATLGPEFGNKVATPGSIIVEKDWATAWLGRPKADLILGGMIGETSQRLNAIIIAEGFTEGQKNNFDQISVDVRTQLLEMTSRHPWNVLAPDINFFRLFLPSKESGNSVFNEIVSIDEWTGVDLVGSIYVEKFAQRNYSIHEYILRADIYFAGNDRPDLKSLRLRPSAPSLNPYTAANWHARYYVSAPFRTPLVTSPSNLSSLIHIVGFPTPADKNTGQNVLRVNKWQKLYDAGMVAIPDDLYEYWESLAERRLLDEVDSVLGTGFGVKPKEDHQFGVRAKRWKDPGGTNVSGRDVSFAKKYSEERSPSYRRVNRNMLNVLLKDLDLVSNVTRVSAGNNFISIEDPVSHQLIYGKDHNAVIVIQNRVRYGGVQVSNATNSDYSDGALINLGTTGAIDFVDVPDPAPTKQSKVDASNPGFTVPDSVMDTITHEIGHAVALGDEYGDRIGILDKAQKTLNIQELASIVNGAGQLIGDNIKWRWLRIAHAGVVKAIDSANFVITVKNGHTTGFVQNEKVYLRKKTLKKKAVSNIQLDSEFSSELEIMNIDRESHQITVSGLTNPGDFLAGSVLLRLVNAKDVSGVGKISAGAGNIIIGFGTGFTFQIGGPGATPGAKMIYDGQTVEVNSVTNDTELVLKDPFARPPVNAEYRLIPSQQFMELLNFTMRKVINQNHLTMLNLPTNLAGQKVNPATDPKGTLPQNPVGSNAGFVGTDFFANLSAINPVNHKHVISLYDGGAEYVSGIYHATGSCAMRNHQVENSLGVMVMSGFCQLCRYILVDRINPALHGQEVENYKVNGNDETYYPDL